MPQVKTELLRIEDFEMRYTINVDKDGVFSTTLPQEKVVLFEAAGVEIYKNRLGNKGYLCANSMDELKKDVKNLVLEYLSRELISEKVVLKFSIQTQCSYAKDREGNFCPNPSKEWTGMGYTHNHGTPDEANKWFGGTLNMHAANPAPYGLQVYVKPFVRMDYKYKSGKIKIEYLPLFQGGEVTKKALKDFYYLRWLNDITAMTNSGSKIEEIDYNEQVGFFFVSLLKGIFMLNEKIKIFSDPSNIILAIEKGNSLPKIG
jgi:hypothetical protein